MNPHETPVDLPSAVVPQRAEQERQRAEQEQQRADAAIDRLKRLEAQLRDQGIDPSA